MGIFTFLNRRRHVRETVLAGFVDDSEDPVGQLSLDGHNIGALILEETDRRVLQLALDRTRATSDTRWTLEIRRRLLGLQFDPELALNHVASLIWARHLPEAASVYEAINPRTTEKIRYQETGIILSAHLHDFDAAEVRLSDHVRDGENIALVPRTEYFRQLFQAGNFEKAWQALGEALAEHPEAELLAAMKIEFINAREGAIAAEEFLESNQHLLRTESVSARRLKGLLLLERGRFRECLEFVSACLADDRSQFALYPLAELSARQCDRADAYAVLLDQAEVVLSSTPELTIMRCNLAADENDFDIAESLLPLIRQRSDWSYHAARLGIACQKPGFEGALKAYEACSAAGLRYGGEEILVANYLYFYRAAGGGLEKAISLLQPLVKSRMHDSGFLRTYLRLLTAQSETEHCRKIFESLPKGLAGSAPLAPFQMYFQAIDGHDNDARVGWGRFLTETAHQGLNAQSSYPKTIRLKYEANPSDVLLFLTVFNGMEYLNWFLEYYRKLGVNHFFIIDNGSDDGTLDDLLRQHDVSVFSNRGSFAESACGVFWVNHLMRRFGIGHWCFHVDMDEAFVFPEMDSGRHLREFLEYLDARNRQSVPAIMIDIYPPHLSASLDADPFALNNYIDTDYFFMPCEIPPYHFVQGGLRARISGRSLLMTKAPLVRMSLDVCYIANNHQHTHVPMSDVTGVLLHYKFVGDIMSRVNEAIDRNEHFMGARFYKAIKEPLAAATGEGSLLSEHSVLYESPSQLVDLGLMHSSEDWAQFQSTL